MLKVALSHAMFYFEVLNSVEFAMRILAEGAQEGKEEWAGYKRTATPEFEREYNDTMKTIEHNIEQLKQELISRH